MNFQEDELKGVRKDRMKIGKSLADVDPMQIDSSVSGFNSLSQHYVEAFSNGPSTTTVDVFLSSNFRNSPECFLSADV